MKPLQLLPLTATLLLCSSATAGSNVGAESDANLFLRACMSKVQLSIAINFKNSSSKTCLDSNLKIASINNDLDDRKLDLSLKSEITYYSLGAFIINVQSKTGRWLSYTKTYFPHQKLSIQFIKEGRAPYSPAVEADKEAITWLHSCELGVRKYVAREFDLSVIKNLYSCADKKLDLSNLSFITGMKSSNFKLESSINSKGSDGYSVSVRSRSGRWFSLVYSFDDLPLQNAPLLTESRTRP